MRLGPNYIPTKFRQNIPSFRATFMRKTDEKRSKRQFFRLSRLIIQPPGGELKNPRVKSCVLVQTPCLPSFVKIFHHLGQLFGRKLTNSGYLVGAFTLFFFAELPSKREPPRFARWLKMILKEFICI